MKPLTLEEKLEILAQPPDAHLIRPPSNYVSAPYLSGEVIRHYLNQIFGPTGWGYEFEEWPELKPLGTSVGYYICRGRVWFLFDTETLIERYVPGLCPVRLKDGTPLEQMPFQLARMSFIGAITDMIKNAASTLGPRLGLGLNDPSLRRELGLDTAQAAKRKSRPPRGETGESKSRKQPERQAAWTENDKRVAGFWAAMENKGLERRFVLDGLGVSDLEEYTGSQIDAMVAVNAAIEAAMAQS